MASPSTGTSTWISTPAFATGPARTDGVAMKVRAARGLVARRAAPRQVALGLDARERSRRCVFGRRACDRTGPRCELGRGGAAGAADAADAGDRSQELVHRV